MNKIFCVSLGMVLLSGCTKTITHNGTVWWQPKNNVEQTQRKDYDSSVFINQNQNNPSNQNNQSNQNITQQYNSQTDISLTNAINNSMENVQQSSLAKQEGQIELTSREKFNQPKQEDKVLENKQNNMQQETVKIEEKNITENKAVVLSKGYKVQCGTFTNERSAQNVANRLKADGLENVNLIKENGTTKILVGNFNNKQEGQQIFDKIKKLGYINDAFWQYR